MKSQFEKLSQGYSLTENESYEFITEIINGHINATQIASALAFYIARPIQLQELNGFKTALMDHRKPVQLTKKAMDVCGTGGDGKNTFNISTLSAIVLSVSGIPIAKHGNYGSTSVSGSSDILKYLGYQFTSNVNELNEQLERYNFCFMHAPLFHPALKNVAQVRKEIGIRTFFNIMGPLVNPANITAKYVGVFNHETARLYNYHLQNEPIKYMVVHSIDGYDEVSLTADIKVLKNDIEQLISPTDLGFPYTRAQDLISGNTIEESAKLFVNILEGEGTPAQNNVVIANSALAYTCYSPSITYSEAKEICTEALLSKKSFHQFKNIINN